MGALTVVMVCCLFAVAVAYTADTDAISSNEAASAADGSCGGTGDHAGARLASASNSAMPHEDSIVYSPIDVRENLTYDEFVDVYASHGRPVVVKDALKSWNAMHKWTLQYLKDTFPGQVANRKPRADEAIFNEAGQIIGRYDPADTKKRLATQRADDEHISWLVQSPMISSILKQDYDLPYFLMGSNTSFVPTGPEYFFMGSKRGQGREMHIDYSCNSVWSAQIQGVKRWRLLSPSAPASILARDLKANTPRMHDTDIAAYEAVLHPGDLIVWYAGWTHGTYALEAPTLALSKEFILPPPMHYISKHMPILKAHSDRFRSYSHCLDSWQHDWELFQQFRNGNSQN